MIDIEKKLNSFIEANSEAIDYIKEAKIEGARLSSEPIQFTNTELKLWESWWSYKKHYDDLQLKKRTLELKEEQHLLKINDMDEDE